ncbi:uncharacterized protein LOC129728530 [Wyeomyia smithii]|uniref:uncharacterized protein LOC129728530 n=1 Tax=Wyeomyia smithii TaxID=174621 RepID=UPI002467BC40|nr:uncharacterized protein LOC129728530 [Wyeomyia smithii]
MWRSFLVLVFGCFVVLRARSVHEEAQAPVASMQHWRNAFDYSTIPLNERFVRETKKDCKCTPKPRHSRIPRIRTVFRRNDVDMDDSEEALEKMLEEYILQTLIKRGTLTPRAIYTPIKPAKNVFRTQKQIHQQLPAFKHERVEYSDEENYRMSSNNRFYSQEPVPGQLLYPPISPKFSQSTRVYPSTQVNSVSKPRYVSSMLIPHFLNNTIAKPNEKVRNILRMNTTNTEDASAVTPKKVRYGKNAGHINLPKDTNRRSNMSNIQK